MAKKRSFRAGVAAASASGADFIGNLIKTIMAEQSAMRRADYQESLDRETALQAQTAARKLAEEQRVGTQTNTLLSNPDAAERLSLQGGSLPGISNLASFGRSPREKVRPRIEDLLKAKTPGDVPSPTALVNQMGAEGVRDEAFQGPFPTMNIPGVGRREQVALPLRAQNERTPIEELLRAREATEGRLLGEERVKNAAIPRIQPDLSTGFQTREGDMVQTTLNPTQEGEKTRLAAASGTQHPAYVEAEKRIKIEMERALGPVMASRAGQVTTAQGMSQMGVDKMRQMLGLDRDPNLPPPGQAARGDQSTQAERTAAGYMPTLAKAEGDAALAEDEGAFLPVLADVTATSPMMRSAVETATGPFGAVSPKSRQYHDAAIEYVNTVGKIFSGVTVRQDEFPRFLYTYFRGTTDTDQQLTQKRQARAALGAAVAIAAGRSAREGGEALGRSIVAGKMSANILRTLNITDPEFLAGLSSIVGPIPQR